MTRRAAHIDIDDVGTGGFRNPGPFGHPARLATGQLNHVRPDAGSLAAQFGHRTAMNEVVAGGHLGHHQPGAEFTRQTSKGSIGDARHRREKNPVRNFNIAYFQWLKA
jgi:hypothetical protein